MKCIWPGRLARAYALIRGLMVVGFSISLIVAPERALVGSSGQPARTLALMFASRTILLGVGLGVLAIRYRPAALAWLLLADGALQAFDTAMAVSMGKGGLAIVPALLGVVDILAGLWLLRES